MTTQNYITVDDIHNDLFNRFSLETRQRYVDMANDEIEDVAKRIVGDDVTIVTPVHYQIKRFGVNFAVQQLCLDKADFNNDNGFGGEDKYERTFKRVSYVIQNIQKKLVAVMFTGDKENVVTRAVNSQRIIVSR